ncbi:MAG: hypothetical protein WAV51_04185 [Microgenomates group bacterium]
MAELSPISGLISQAVKLQGERFGTEGEFTMQRHLFHIKTDKVGMVDYPVHIIKRENNPHLQTGETPVDGGVEQALLMSGFATEGADWLREAEDIFLNNPSLKQVTLLDHPSSAPTVRHEKQGIPLNDDSFQNSAEVVSQALEQLLANKQITEGQVAIGLSTGTAVLTELAALNPKLVGDLVLVAPAGMTNRTEAQMSAGVTTGGAEYMGRFFEPKIKRSWERIKQPDTYLSKEKQQKMPTSPVGKFLYSAWNELMDNYVKPLQNKLKNPEKTVDKEPVMVVRHVPKTREGYWEELDKNMPAKSLRIKDFIFELGFKLGRKFPRFWQHFTGMWGDARPHIPVENADYVHDRSLIPKDTSSAARSEIHDKKIIMVLGMQDGAVPPEEFISQEDRTFVNGITDENTKGETMLERIMTGAKNKFPNNKDTTVMLTVGGPSGHVELKTETGLYGFMISRALNSLTPPKTTIYYKKESSWQSP